MEFCRGLKTRSQFARPHCVQFYLPFDERTIRFGSISVIKGWVPVMIYVIAELFVNVAGTITIHDVVCVQLKWIELHNPGIKYQLLQ